jgi:sugar fermentation stimulation protein A
MEGVRYLHPNDATDPDFGAALREAAENGVQVLAMDCKVQVGAMTIHTPVEVRLEQL